MRLWHEALIPYLPRQQLLGLHREVCALRGRGWGKPHSVVNYVFTHSRGYLVRYHQMVMDEMAKRGYKADPMWRGILWRGKNIGEDHTNAVGDCFGWSSAQARIDDGLTIYPEHDDAYLRECLENLAGKGIHIDMGVK